MKNLYKVLNIIALAAVIALMGGCFSPWAGDGATITINVGGGSGRAVFPPDDETLAQIRYTVELQGPSNITEQLAHGTQSINLSVIPGDYTITVTARLAEGELYAISIATAVARAGQSTRVDITMNYVGDGFIIFFETGSGSYIDPQIVRRGEKVERPQKNPTWSIYGFVDWYSDKDLKNKFDFDEPVISSVTSNITLYAKWNQVTHTVTFDSNNDSGAIASEIVGDGGTLPQPEDPVLNGFVFGGWYIDDDEYVFNTEIYNNITLCARWNEPIFNDIADLGAYLSKWSANDPENPYTVSLTVDNISTLRTTLNANAGKYVYLDLTGSNMIEEIPANAFYGSANPRGCATLAGITIPNSVKIIGNYAFGGCANLAGIAIPDSVETIGNNAFNNCTKLASVELPINDYFTSIGNGAFINCTNLTSMSIPNSVTSIGNNAFAQCTELTSVIIPNSVTSIGNDAFAYSGLTSMSIPNSVTSIGNNAFAYSGLTSVTIGTGIGYDNFGIQFSNSIFIGCTDLAEINVDTSNTTLSSEDGIVYNKAQTVLVMYPPGKTAPSFTIPNTVTSIARAFNNCTNLTSVTIGTGISLDSSSSFTWAFNGCTNLTAINVDPNNTTLISENGIVYNKTKTYLVLYPVGKTDAFTIPNTVQVIWSDSFFSCTITSVTIPDSVKFIYNQAFSSCRNLTSVTFQGTIASSQFNTSLAFSGDLRTKFYATDPDNGTPGTYTTTAPVSSSSVWTKQQP